MLFCHVVITVCACTFVTCTLIKINQSINIYYGTLIGSHRWPIDPCRFQWPRVTLKGGAWGAKIFWQIYYACTVLPRMTRIWHGNWGGGEAYFSGFSHSHISRGPKKLEPSPTPKMPKATKFGNGNKRRGTPLYQGAAPAQRPQNFLEPPYQNGLAFKTNMDCLFPACLQFGDLLYARRHDEKQQPNFPGWSNYTRQIFTRSTTTADARSVCSS